MTFYPYTFKLFMYHPVIRREHLQCLYLVIFIATSAVDRSKEMMYAGLIYVAINN
jgi:hypothetical protein